jgi:tetratricopeptide (TPR) repeat protein
MAGRATRGASPGRSVWLLAFLALNSACAHVSAVGSKGLPRWDELSDIYNAGLFEQVVEVTAPCATTQQISVYVADCLLMRGMTLTTQGRLGEAKVALERAVVVGREADPRSMEYGSALEELASLCMTLGEDDRFEANAELAQTVLKPLAGARAVQAYVHVLGSLARRRSLQGRAFEAEGYGRAALEHAVAEEEDGSAVALARTMLANTLTDQERYDEAEVLLRRAEAHYQRTTPGGHHALGSVYKSLGNVQYLTERYSEARETYLRALAWFERFSGLETLSVAGTLDGLGLTLQKLKDPAAEQHLLRSLALFVKLVGEVGAQAREERYHLARYYFETGRYEAGLPFARASVCEPPACSGDDPEDTYRLLGWFEAKLVRPRESRVHLERALEFAQQRHGASSKRAARVRGDIERLDEHWRSVGLKDQ